MSQFRRATENENTNWLPLPETPLCRFVLAEPSLKFSDTYGRWNVQFPMAIHPDWKARILPKSTTPLPLNTQQSDRAFYQCTLTWGFFNNQHVYQSTNFVDFLAACFGVQGGKKFRKWVEAGGGNPRPLDRDDDKAEIQMTESWLRWLQGCEIYGSIRHEPDRTGSGKMWPRFGGFMPIGSLPNEPLPDVQTLLEGKFRSMELETKAADEAYEALLKERAKQPLSAPVTSGEKVTSTAATVDKATGEVMTEMFDAYGRPVGGEGGNGNDPDDEEDPPF